MFKTEKKWCSKFPNGQSKPSWLVNCAPNKKILEPGIYIPPPTPPPPLSAYFYNMVESPYFLAGNFCGFLDGYTPINLLINSLVVEGTEYIVGPPISYTLNSGTINLVPANNNVQQYSALDGCSSVTTGFTYTNFATFLNSTFNSLSVPSITAQTSYVGRNLGSNSSAGFYLVYNSGLTFNVEMTSDSGSPAIINYTQTGASTIFSLYYKSTNTGITIVNGVVVE